MKKENQPYTNEDMGILGVPAWSSVMSKKIMSLFKTKPDKWWQQNVKSDGGLLYGENADELKQNGKELCDEYGIKYSSEYHNFAKEIAFILGKSFFPIAKEMNENELDFTKKIVLYLCDSAEQKRRGYYPDSKEKESYTQDLKQSFEHGLRSLIHQP